MTYLAAILIIGVLIFVHELGHLLACWGTGIPVARFSIGFGPVLWTWRRGDTEYCLSAIPLGGYVMPAVESEEDFFAVAVWRRIVMWLGGPAANFAFAALILAVVGVAVDGFSLYGLLVEPWVEVARQSWHIVTVLPSAFLHPSQLSGVVGIVSVGNSFVGAGWLRAAQFAVLLSLNLGIFNLLPIAPLDGGKIFCALLEKLHPRLARLHTGFAIAGLALLLVLFVYTTVLDVVRQLA
ncbi:MAG: site-2 protease family protein [Pirellulales bacterium]